MIRTLLIRVSVLLLAAILLSSPAFALGGPDGPAGRANLCSHVPSAGAKLL